MEVRSQSGGRVLVVGLSAEELIGAAVVGLALEGRADAVALAHLGDGAPFAAPMAAWWAAQAHPVEVRPFEGTEGFDRVVAVGSALDRAVPEAIASHRGASFALVGAGAFAHELEPTRRALMDAAAAGRLREAALIPRYERVGRALIELVEEVHHAVGPDRQSRVADTLRAALFGRQGRVPVSLATREDPPCLDPLTLMVFFLDLQSVP